MSNQNLKVPTEIESEIAIIGCIFLDPEIIYQVGDILTPDDFYDTKNRLIFRTMVDINKQGRAIDATTVIADLTIKGVLEQAGGPSYIASIADYSYSTANVESYIELIENAALRRNTINALNALAQKGYNSQVPAYDYIDDVEKTVFDLSKRRRVEDFKTIVLDRYRQWNTDRMIFECSLLQNTVEDMILFRCFSDEEIIGFYRHVLKALEGKDYRIVYLNAEDISGNLAVIRKERSDENGNELWFPLMLQYFNDSPYAKKKGLEGEEALIRHFIHRRDLELRICKEIFPDRSVILPSKKYTDEQIAGL